MTTTTTQTWAARKIESAAKCLADAAHALAKKVALRGELIAGELHQRGYVFLVLPAPK